MMSAAWTNSSKDQARTIVSNKEIGRAGRSDRGGVGLS